MQLSQKWLAAVIAACCTLTAPIALAQDQAATPPAEEAHAGHEGWLISFDEAKKVAAEEKKDILMEFTGSDWCPPCKALYANVISQDLFKQQAPEHFTLLLLDNPRDKSHQSEEEQAQYRDMAARYGVRGVPTIMLCDAEGRPYASMVGYGGNSAEEYVENLKAQTEKRVRRDENLAAAEGKTGVERARLLGAALEEIDPALCIAVYRDIVDEIIALDADNEAGLKDKFAGLIRKSEIEAGVREIMASAGEAGPEAALGKLDEMIAKYSAEGEELQQLLFAKANLLFAVDKAKSKETLLEAQAAAPESAMARQIDQILQRAFADEAPAGGGN